MPEVKYNKTAVIKYLLFTFVTAYLIQAGAAVIYNAGQIQTAQLILAAMMFVPMIGVLVSGTGLKTLGWKLQLKKNIRWILLAWFLPAVLTAVGAVLYYLVFPGHLDLSGSAMIESLGPEAMAQLVAQGLTYPMYVLISAAAALTYAPLINVFPSLGEEAGWRGFLYPQLKAKYGKLRGQLIGGIIWGMWHWPLIWLIGYEYGTEYVGFPVVGMLVFCVFTIATGILCDTVYERSQSIWLPSLLHGAFNAAGGIPLMIWVSENGSMRLLGPAPNGLLAGLPLLIAAVLLSGRQKTV